MPGAKPTVYLIAGCNGAGKTTFAKEFLPSIGVIRFLNADEIARGLSPLKPEAVAFKAGRLLLNELRELFDATREVVGRNPPLTLLLICEASSLFMKKNLYNGLKPIPESKMSPEARLASDAHRRATRKKRAELRRRGLPLIIWKDGKVREVPA